MIKLALVGHRGVGKSTLLNQLGRKFPGVLCVSLDQWIMDKEGKTIQEIFASIGEIGFREIEKKYFIELCKKNEDKNIIVDFGAGFKGEIPKDFKILWLQRAVDLSKFQFLDRPNLDSKSSLRMSEQRFYLRDKRFQEIADLEIEVMEGIEADDNLMSFISSLEGKNTDSIWQPTQWYLTLLSSKQGKALKNIQWSHNFEYELRDDLLDGQYIKEVLADRPKSLVSLRRVEIKEKTLKNLHAKTLWDWPLEWGENHEAPILSLHTKEGEILKTLKALPESDQWIKLALPVSNFKELIDGYSWQQEAPDKRVFLPLSANGRWAWYRLLLANEMKLNFFRLGRGSAHDQPTLLEVLNHRSEWKNFAAILGEPVKQSLTPSYHRGFFQNLNNNIMRVALTEVEVDRGLPFLNKLGLKQAAVSSPLKEKMGLFLKQGRKPINTLNWTGAEPTGTNTDCFGFAELFKDLASKTVAVWGGGGTHEAIKELLPGACFYSSRTGDLKKGNPLVGGPEVIVWAVGCQSFDKRGVFPDSSWNPEWVIDLNYTLDSPGIQCAYNYGCQYRSGMVMFEAQAIKQQEYWNECRLK